MTSITRFAGLALASLLSACSAVAPDALTAPDSSSRIQGGTYTGSSYPSVGALMVDFQPAGLTGDDEVCTGTLISPTVFLTAAHCVEWVPAGTQFYVSFAPDLYASGIKVIKATSYAYDAAYGHDNSDPHDIAVVILPASATKGMTPMRLPAAGELDALNAKNGLSGATFINVGYGVSASRTGQPTFSYDGRRSMSESRFSALQDAWLDLLMNTAATGGGGDCYGDSGGPKFLKSNPGVVYATTITGDYVCRAKSRDYRMDSQSARAFLGSYVKLP